MKATTFFASALAVVGMASATPPGYGQCISQQEGEQWLKSFIGVLGKTDPNYQQTATKILAPNFVESSNSILSLQALPLGHPGISAPNRDAWIQGISHAPAPAGIKTLDVIVACDKLVWSWDFDAIGSAKYPAVGFNLFHLKRNGRQIQADTLHLEFDSIAWGLDTGIKVTYPNGKTLP